MWLIDYYAEEESVMMLVSIPIAGWPYTDREGGIGKDNVEVS